MRSGGDLPGIPEVDREVSDGPGRYRRPVRVEFCTLIASMPTLEVSQPVVAALVMTAATIELARVDASVTRKQLATDLPAAAGQPA